MTVSLDGINAELRARVERLLLLGEGKFWVTSALRTRFEQESLYKTYTDAVVKYGRDWNKYAVLAAVPGTSMHEKGLAVDVGCAPEHQVIQAKLGALCGLYQAVPGEHWHFQLSPSRVPLPPLPTPPPPPQTIEDDEDDMSDAKTIEYPTGHKTVVTDDGGIKNAGSPFFGSIPGLKPENRKSFTKPFALTAVDPQDELKGYIIHDVSGDKYQFDADVAARIKAGTI
jgi:hypothetical protein